MDSENISTLCDCLEDCKILIFIGFSKKYYFVNIFCIKPAIKFHFIFPHYIIYILIINNPPACLNESLTPLGIFLTLLSNNFI